MSTKTKQSKQQKLLEIDEQILKKFEIKKKLGKGAYGIVWKGTDKTTNQTVAVKKIFDAFRNETDAQRTYREITFLRAFRDHPNVIQLYEIHKASNNMDIYLTFEYMESDLHNVIKRGTILKDIHRRYIMYQLLNAIKYIHSGNVIHRDLKPSNILIDNKCRCKIADFGLARSVSNKQILSRNSTTNFDVKEPALTDYVATRWYRAPEILVASKKYTKGIDMWSIGCILGEMLRGKPLFPGTSTVNQIEKIKAALPPPTEEDIMGVGISFGTVLLNQQIQNPNEPKLDDLITGAPEDAKSLVKSLLLFNPEIRLTAKQAICHKYISKFRYSSAETELQYDILPPFRDDVQLSVPEYRSKLYEIVEKGIFTNSGKAILSAKSSTGQNYKLEDFINVIPVNPVKIKKLQSSTVQNTVINGTNNEKKQHLDKYDTKNFNYTNNTSLPQNNVPVISTSTSSSLFCTSINSNKITKNYSTSLLSNSNIKLSSNNNIQLHFNQNHQQIQNSINKKNPKIKYCKISSLIESDINNSETSLSDKSRNQQHNISKYSSTCHKSNNNNNNNIKNNAILKRHSIDCGSTLNANSNDPLLLRTNHHYQSTSMLTDKRNIDEISQKQNNNIQNFNKNGKLFERSKKLIETTTNQQSSSIMPPAYYKKSQNNLRKTISSSIESNNKKLDNHYNNNNNSSSNRNTFSIYGINSNNEHDDDIYEKRLKNLQDKIQQRKNDTKNIFTSSLLSSSSSTSKLSMKNQHNKQNYKINHNSINYNTNNNNNDNNLSNISNNNNNLISDKYGYTRKKNSLLRSKSETSNTMLSSNNNSNNNKQKSQLIKNSLPIKFDYTYSEGDQQPPSYINNSTMIKKRGNSIISEFGVITAKDYLNLRKSQVIS